MNFASKSIYLFSPTAHSSTWHRLSSYVCNKRDTGELLWTVSLGFPWISNVKVGNCIIHDHEPSPFRMFSRGHYSDNSAKGKSAVVARASSPGWMQKVQISLTPQRSHAEEWARRSWECSLLGWATCTTGPFVQRRRPTIQPGDVAFLTTAHWLCSLAGLVSEAVCFKSSHVPWQINEEYPSELQVCKSTQHPAN